MHRVGVIPTRMTSEAKRVATDWQIPATTSSRFSPEANWEMTSDSEKTVQVEEIFEGLAALKYSPSSWATSSWRILAMTSRKRPVPAAHLSFIWKLVMIPDSVMDMTLASCPPMSMSVRASGTWEKTPLT